MPTLYQLSYRATAASSSNLDNLTFLWPQRLPTASEVTPGLRTELSDLINPCYHASLTSKWLHELDATHGITSSIDLRGFPQVKMLSHMHGMETSSACRKNKPIVTIPRGRTPQKPEHLGENSAKAEVICTVFAGDSLHDVRRFGSSPQRLRSPILPCTSWR